MELTIIGQPAEEVKGPARTDLLKQEVRRVVGQLKGFTSPLVEGSSKTSISIVVDFNFKLEE